jgi:hypothetical protein
MRISENFFLKYAGEKECDSGKPIIPKTEDKVIQLL